MTVDHGRVLSELFAAISLFSMLVLWSTRLPNPDALAVVYLLIAAGYVCMAVMRVGRELEARKRRRKHET